MLSGYKGLGIKILQLKWESSKERGESQLSPKPSIYCNKLWRNSPRSKLINNARLTQASKRKIQESSVWKQFHSCQTKYKAKERTS